MTIIDWRSNPERLSLAVDMLNQPTLKQMLNLVEFEYVTGNRPRVLRDGFDASLEMGKIMGRQEIFEAIRSLSVPLPPPQEELPITWGVEPLKTDTK